MYVRRIVLPLNIRYTKTHFILKMTHDTVLSSNKVSALRGGIGTMLLNANCIGDRQCEKCSFREECLVQRMMYSRFDIKPDYITTGESVGYVYECENHKREFKKGDTLDFNLILFGKSIVHFSQYIQSVFALGQCGLGTNNSHFIISAIKNEDGEDILQNNNILMSNYKLNTLNEYVEKRLKCYDEKDISNLKITFHSPVTIKYRGEFIRQFDIDALISSLVRRIEMLNYYEGKPLVGSHLIDNIPEIKKQHSYHENVNRYSSRHKENIKLHGLLGSLILNNVDNETLKLLLAGELLHIGKNTSFGFGRYTVD